MSSNLALGLSKFNLRMDKSPVQKIYEFEDFRFDAEHLMLYRRGETIPLAPKAAEALLVFIERRGQILSKKELIEQIWPNAFVEESNLFLYLSVLRKTLGNQKDGVPYLETLKRRGYRFNGSVQLTSDNRQEPRSTQFQVIEPIDSFRSPTADSLSVNDLPTDPSVRRQIDPVVNDPLESQRDWPLRRWSFAGIGVIALMAAIALSYTYFFSRRSINSIAVMPFANESGDPKLEYLSNGLTDNLIESLSKVPGLEVKANSTVFRYKGVNSDARRIGQELNVDAVLFAHLIETGEDLTLRVELVDSRNGNIPWQRTYQKKVSGLVVLQSELTRDLVRKLSIPITGTTREKLAKRDTENSDAKFLYLSGVFHQRKITEQDIKKAIDLFWQAIQKDPEYARAYAAMATAHRSLTMCCDGPPSELLEAKLAAQKAVALDDELAEGHSALAASIYSYDWNWAEAEKEFLRALELDPNSSISHFLYGDFLGRMRRGDEAAVEKDRALDLEPYEPFFHAHRAGGSPGRDPEKALERILFAIDLDPNFYFSHLLASGIYSGKKKYPEAIEEARLAKKLSPEQTWSDVGLCRTLVDAGRPKEARAILDQLLLRSKSHFVPPYHIAIVYNYLGDKELAIEWLEKAYDIRDPKMTFLKTMSWKNVENDPRFQDIVRRVGLVGAK